MPVFHRLISFFCVFVSAQITPEGRIVSVAGDRVQPWLSLDGIAYSICMTLIATILVCSEWLMQSPFVVLASPMPVTIEDGWAALDGYRAPSVSTNTIGNVTTCWLSGVIRGGGQSGELFIAGLPSVCFPPSRLMFYTAFQAKSVRLEVSYRCRANITRLTRMSSQVTTSGRVLLVDGNHGDIISVSLDGIFFMVLRLRSLQYGRTSEFLLSRLEA